MRVPTIIDIISLVFSYINSSHIHALLYDKLLRALTTSKWHDLIVNMEE